jgi:hypothetical protein
MGGIKDSRGSPRSTHKARLGAKSLLLEKILMFKETEALLVWWPVIPFCQPERWWGNPSSAHLLQQNHQTLSLRLTGEHPARTGIQTTGSVHSRPSEGAADFIVSLSSVEGFWLCSRGFSSVLSKFPHSLQGGKTTVGGGAMTASDVFSLCESN